MTDGLMKSNTIQWGTPKDLFDLLDREFHFNLDVCASDGMEMCKRYYNPETDGLKQDWTENDVCWMNPPYGRSIIDWVKKAALSPSVTVGLLPARTDTKWYKSWVEPYASEIRFIKGRVKFNGLKRGGAPFPSIIAIWNTARTPRYGVIEYD